MKNTLKTTVMALICSCAIGVAYADEQTANHPEGQKQDANMEMHEHMKECMEKHKDGKTCNHEMMKEKNKHKKAKK